MSTCKIGHTFILSNITTVNNNSNTSINSNIIKSDKTISPIIKTKRIERVLSTIGVLKICIYMYMVYGLPEEVLEPVKRVPGDLQ